MTWETRDKLFKILAKRLDVTPDEIVTTASLADYYLCDSLELAGILVVVQRTFGVQFPQTAYDTTKTVSDIETLLENTLTPGGAQI